MGPAISFLTSCWLLPQKEQYKIFLLFVFIFLNESFQIRTLTPSQFVSEVNSSFDDTNDPARPIGSGDYVAFVGFFALPTHHALRDMINSLLKFFANFLNNIPDLQDDKVTDIELGHPLVIAGPCSAETETQMMSIANELKDSDVSIFRAGIWKPRTRPGMFEGVGSIGLKWLQKVKKETGLLTASKNAQDCLQLKMNSQLNMHLKPATAGLDGISDAMGNATDSLGVFSNIVKIFSSLILFGLN